MRPPDAVGGLPPPDQIQAPELTRYLIEYLGLRGQLPLTISGEVSPVVVLGQIGEGGNVRIVGVDAGVNFPIEPLPLPTMADRYALSDRARWPAPPVAKLATSVTTYAITFRLNSGNNRIFKFRNTNSSPINARLVRIELQATATAGVTCFYNPNISTAIIQQTTDGIQVTKLDYMSGETAFPSGGTTGSFQRQKGAASSQIQVNSQRIKLTAPSQNEGLSIWHAPPNFIFPPGGNDHVIGTNNNSTEVRGNVILDIWPITAAQKEKRAREARKS